MPGCKTKPYVKESYCVARKLKSIHKHAEPPKARNDKLGYGVSLSADGNIVVSTGLNTDELKIWIWSSCTTTPTTSSTRNVSFYSIATLTLYSFPHHLSKYILIIIFSITPI